MAARRVLDAFNLPRGHWEARDEKDDLRVETNKKFDAGYPAHLICLSVTGC
jgi:hypothetical protein